MILINNLFIYILKLQASSGTPPSDLPLYQSNQQQQQHQFEDNQTLTSPTTPPPPSSKFSSTGDPFEIMSTEMSEVCFLLFV